VVFASGDGTKIPDTGYVAALFAWKGVGDDVIHLDCGLTWEFGLGEFEQRLFVSQTVDWDRYESQRCLVLLVLQLKCRQAHVSTGGKKRGNG
jgi:hypothetical protein